MKLLFEKNHAYFIIEINNKVIKYYDKLQGKIWGTSLQYLPPDPEIKKKIIMSRNKIPQQFIELFEVTKEEMKEYEDAKDDNELKEIVIRDCHRHGCKLIDVKIE